MLIYCVSGKTLQKTLVTQDTCNTIFNFLAISLLNYASNKLYKNIFLVKLYYILSTVYLPMIPYNIFASFNF